MDCNISLHPDIIYLHDLTGAPEDELEGLLESWDLFEISFSDEEKFVCRGLSIHEYDKLTTLYPEEQDIIDHVFDLCVLWTNAPIEDIDSMPAGIATTIAKTVLDQSGFTADSGDMVKEKIDEQRKAMDLFTSQIPCIIHEAFQDIPMETIIRMPFTKLVWYYTRAEWILNNLRPSMGAELGVDEEEAGNETDFAELRSEKLFKQGKLKG